MATESILQDKKFLFLVSLLLAVISYKIYYLLFPRKDSYMELYNEIISYNKYKVKGKFE